MSIVGFCCRALGTSLLFASGLVNAQGTFQNLDFESANTASYLPGSMIPVSAAMPGWSVFVGGTQLQQMWYDVISAGSPEAVITDGRGVSFPPLQGNYSAVLFGGISDTTTITQTGVVPAGIKSLVADMYWSAAPPVVTVNGQTITMFPEAIFPRYTVYAGNIAAFAGQTAT